VIGKSIPKCAAEHDGICEFCDALEIVVIMVVELKSRMVVDTLDLAIVPIPPNTPSVHVLYTAGSVGSPMPTEPPTLFPKDDFEQQAINCFLNVKASLALRNGTPWYIPNYEASYRDILINATRNFFADYDGHASPSTLVGVKDLALPWYKAELEAVAAVGVRASTLSS
jgi:enamine deaminase RidA (YjgF/YER057c/UK114 family)